ncbi:PD-(D/E)XK nuclease family protein [Saccharopolyspora phatthalungensis]|uniref:PD-(D/E)XK endonuclease-like domain-containing protein n=1 Tax=Saccharopolyspora phatthalungensis TaxID=664693 RepID=A0A840QK93_9PSEU|nr:PD-(D/E)XK nuclease family protein [Saccharopolyspora phatthalungensis]MBB5159705.1 hypothetical protein [Saccharopolyspora phatthalungensis]
MNDTLPPQLPYRGRPNSIKIKATLLGQQSQACPARSNMEARPGIAPPTGWSLRRDPWPFLLGAVIQAVTAVHRGADETDAIRKANATVSRQGISLHPLAREYLASAVWNYLEAHEDRQADLGPLGLSNERLIQHPGKELAAWGMYYQSPDGAIREVRRLRLGQVRGAHEDDLAWAAVAAKLAADGTRDGGTNGDQEPDRVVITEIGLADAGSTVLADLNAAGARDLYANAALPRIRRLIAGTDLRPCWDCGQCRWLSICPSVPDTPGLLGLSETGTHTRTVSASDLDRYAVCPAQYFATRVLHLPGENDQTSAQTRGLAVHSWLAAAHSRPAHPACTPADLPEPGTAPPACADVLTEDEYREAWPFLRQHLHHCPLHQADRDRRVQVEPSYYAHDSACDVLLATTPDLTYGHRQAPIWRETKTTQRPLPTSEDDALSRFLPAAVHIVLLAALAARHSITAPANPSVELEVLGHDDSRTYSYDVTDPHLVDHARALVAQAASEWSRDTAFTTRPSTACHSCSVSRWCADRMN